MLTINYFAEPVHLTKKTEICMRDQKSMQNLTRGTSFKLIIITQHKLTLEGYLFCPISQYKIYGVHCFLLKLRIPHMGYWRCPSQTDKQNIIYSIKRFFHSIKQSFTQSLLTDIFKQLFLKEYILGVLLYFIRSWNTWCVFKTVHRISDCSDVIVYLQ